MRTWLLYSSLHNCSIHLADSPSPKSEVSASCPMVPRVLHLWGGRRHAMSYVLVTLLHSYTLQISLRDLLPYTKITRWTWGAQEHPWRADGCRTGRPQWSTGPVWPRNPKGLGISASHCLTRGLLAIKASIKAPVLGGRREQVWERQESTNTSVCNVYIS